MKLSRDFYAPWPAVLVEMEDFVDLARLYVGGDYTLMAVHLVISKVEVPAEWLNLPAFLEFRTAIEATPRIRTVYKAAEQASHRVDIDIQR